MAAATALAIIALANWPVHHLRVAAMLWHADLPFPPTFHCRNCGLHYFRDAQRFGSRDIPDKLALLELPTFVVEMGGQLPFFANYTCFSSWNCMCTPRLVSGSHLAAFPFQDPHTTQLGSTVFASASDIRRLKNRCCCFSMIREGPQTVRVAWIPERCLSI